ncbi:carbohydrate-binding protein [Paenibacillus sp. GCM10023250]|uniref:carbohydrate-binding protein n=1 Tax=Paenibacillus sp. GCM10023250 TaxID=3252648 RepID=UPI0036167983
MMRTLSKIAAVLLAASCIGYGAGSLPTLKADPAEADGARQIVQAVETAADAPIGSYEAEASGNPLTGNASAADCAACSGGKKVGGLYQGSSMRFTDIEATEAGQYDVAFAYISGDPRGADIRVNGGAPEHYDFAKTADWDTLGSKTIRMTLKQGANTIDISDGGGYAPDFDKIDVKPANDGFEAEDPGNTLTGNASVNDCGGCSGGKKVGNLYQGASLQFNGIQVPAAGSYTVTVHYISGDARAADVSVNGGAAHNILFPATGDWNTTGTYAFAAQLKAGDNAILFSDGGGYAPDFDKLVVTVDDGSAVQPCERAAETPAQPGASVASKKEQSITVKQFAGAVVADNGKYAVTVDLKTGLASYAWQGKTVAKGVYSKFGDQASSCYGTHTFAMADVKPIKDGFGKGISLKIVNKQEGQPDLTQIYQIYAGETYFLTRTEAQGTAPVAANRFAPVVTNTAGGIDAGVASDGRVLTVPYDNDMWIRSQGVPINSSDTSYEVSAVYDNASRSGLVVGSVTHDTWKTGIRFAGADNKLNALEVYGGASSAKTHDSQPHGTVTGTLVRSPMAFVGYYEDYRTGMEAYGRANAVIAPPLAFGKDVPQGVPVGWNSWAAYESRLTFQDVIDTSNFIKASLQKHGLNNDGTTYVNMDSYWDNLSDAQLKDAVAAIKRNGQKPGIYWGPFVYWGDNMDQPVEGSATYKYGDIILRDAEGRPLPKLDGAYAIDPTHPGAKQRMDYYLNKFKQLGFEYIKLDFLTHGALEGKHYDPNVLTGTQAYNQGMAYVDKLVADRMFISESIAPLFPSQYAHSRRIATDTFGSISDTEFELNALTYGWWQNGTIYHYNDPDHMALTRAGSLEEARSRVNSAVISGTVFLDSDDVHDARAQEYMKALLTNKAVLALAKKGESFRPVEGNTGARAADAFVLKDKNTYYLAVFNYAKTAAGKTIDLARAGLNGAASYKATDLWTNAVSTASGQLTVQLGAAESKLFKLEPAK